MTTPFEYCVICDGYGGNGAPCSRCGNDSGSPLRLAEKKKQLTTWEKWILNTIWEYISQMEFIDRANMTVPTHKFCQFDGYFDASIAIWFGYCQYCGNYVVRD